MAIISASSLIIPAPLDPIILEKNLVSSALFAIAKGMQSMMKPQYFDGLCKLVRTMAKKVMIVEDNELNMKLFHDLLHTQNYETIETSNGLDAVELARQHMPDLILMDIQLPEVSGLDVTKWIKEDDALKMIPVIAITAFAMKGDEERIRQGGCEAYISKPISVSKFLETIRSYLGDA